MDSGHREGIFTVDSVLDRHDKRRQCGVPTVSVLVGPVALGMPLVRQWAETLVRPIVFVRPEQPDPDSVIIPWVDELAEKCDLVDVAVGWLARRLKRASSLIDRSLRTMTSHEVCMFLESALPLVSESGVELVSRHLIECAPVGERPGGPEFAPILDSILEGYGRRWIRVFTAMGELVPQERLPVLVLTPASQSMSSVHGIARLLAELAGTQPRAAVILLVESPLFDNYLAQAPASRAKALLRESVVTLTCPGFHTANGTVAMPIESLEPEFWESPDAVSELKFENLIEVDLAARDLKLVIEIDGYHHFQDPLAYRRDRRKDLELQKHGYLVARVLAGDVVERLEEVMDMISSAVVFRRLAVTRDQGKP
jgi:hypothetical protein